MSTESDEKHADIVERAVHKIEQAFKLRPEAEQALRKIRATEAAWRWIKFKHLPSSEAMVLLAFAKDPPSPGVECERSQLALANEVGCHRTTIIDALKRLEDRGLVESIDRTGRPKTYALRFIEKDPPQGIVVDESPLQRLRIDEQVYPPIQVQIRRRPRPRSMDEMLMELVLDLCDLMEQEIATAAQKVVSTTANSPQAR